MHPNQAQHTIELTSSQVPTTTIDSFLYLHARLVNVTTLEVLAEACNKVMVAYLSPLRRLRDGALFAQMVCLMGPHSKALVPHVRAQHVEYLTEPRQ
jgi:hypothetical protein